MSTPHDRHLLVVGAGLAGLRAVEGARAAGWAGRITIVGDEPHAPYDRPPLSKAVLAADEPPPVPALRSEEVLETLQVRHLPGVRAEALDTERRMVTTTSGELGYDALIIATGSAATTVPELSGVRGVHVLRRYDDALAVREAMARSREVVIVGAGFIGSEIASAARARGIGVTIVEASERPLERAVGPAAAVRLMQLHADAGVRLLTATTVSGVRSTDVGVDKVELSTGETLAADAVVLGIGARPATAWLRDSGVELDARSGGVLCDSRLATSAPGVWAAGDIACVDGVRSEHWTAAGEQGRVAGANAAGADAGGATEVFAAVPFAWSSWHGHRIQVVGETTAAGEEDHGDGFVLYRRRGAAVGAVGINSPGPMARLRRALTAQTNP
ncbi:NAD(P)/FAD-dependent oxidoreductase [Nocardioides albus]|uniref:NADPH-dependent 2,4-dienoyl-CoA reductase/sulfur reductase-like enzyme n=1 Tax=Nocardioides albus TaxID=1841 RepID=A0A7W5A3W4_9ACTN|nr:FAD-dependent oxidoreductase [Nocardioides albus]MBB3089061.1 NADPH-dependent 2,4-dienoyl-CoA reductase/sulfur reductase-like enzyme [Nocardioides albus]GGU14492.1 ferredoxin reductase [Nocardioides albus]